LGVLSSLLNKDDLIVMDKLSHASLIDAAKLSGARLRIYPHKNMKRLEKILDSETRKAASHPERSEGSQIKILRRSANRKAPQNDRANETGFRTAIVTDSVFSMDGDKAPLKELVRLKEKHNAFLIVDEAHGFGVFGKEGRGASEADDILDNIDVYIATLSKAVGLIGGFVAGNRSLIEYLINRARTFIYDTALPPGVAAAASLALEKIKKESLREKLWDNVNQIRMILKNIGYEIGSDSSPIIPIILGSEEKALNFSNKLLEKGVLIPAVRYPTVAKGKARLRLTVSAAHSKEDINKLKEALNSLKS
jgi:8-amino-7-oxononanoate synthase